MQRSTKLFIGGSMLLTLIGALGAYWFFVYEPPKPERPKRDPYAFTVPPVAYPMNGYTFMVPEQLATSVVLDMIAPSTRRDYPMGRFTVATGTGMGSLHVIDDMASPIVDGRQVVPMIVENGGSGSQVYLAVLDVTGSPARHVSSILLGDRIRIESLTLSGTTATVAYLVHDRGQVLTDIPTVNTTAIVDITTNTFVQEGRKPWLEEVVVFKEFKGDYRWKETRGSADVVAPGVPEKFTLRFDTNRVTLGTDCNTASAEFTPPAGSSTAMAFTNLAQTKMFCQSAEEALYFDMITKVTSFVEEGNTLTFSLSDNRTMEFVRIGQELEFASTTAEVIE